MGNVEITPPLKLRNKRFAVSVRWFLLLLEFLLLYV